MNAGGQQREVEVVVEEVDVAQVMCSLLASGNYELVRPKC